MLLKQSMLLAMLQYTDLNWITTLLKIVTIDQTAQGHANTIDTYRWLMQLAPQTSPWQLAIRYRK